MSNTNLILLPGFLSDATLWEHQVKHLNHTANIKVIPLLSENTAEKMIDKVLDSISGPFALAGHSIGGWVALEVARKAPARVIKLCVLNTMARPDTPEILKNRKKRIDAIKADEFEKFAAELVNFFVINKAVKIDILDMFLSVGAQAVINQQNAMINRKASLTFLKEIHCPTLVIAARKDPYFSVKLHEEMLNYIPHGKLAIVEDSGHMSPMEMPQAVTALMQYWLSYF
jgi:pimeloyl-ACP methyl ester carboxylesterase